MTTTAKPIARGRWIAGLLLIGMVLAALVVAEFGLGAYREYVRGSDNLDSGMFQADPQVGWSLKPGWSGHHRHHDFRTRYTINDAGLRYDPTAQGDLVDAPEVWLAGDAQTFGLGVGNRQTFATELNRWVRQRVRFVNLGVPGYSTEQEVMLIERYLRSGHPQTVILVTNLADDLLDIGAPFPIDLDNPKPFYSLEDGRLVLHNSPVPRITKSAKDRGRSFFREIVATAPAEERNPVENWLGRSSILAAMGVHWPPDHDIGLTLPERTRASLDLYEALIGHLEEILRAKGVRLALALLPGPAYLERPGSHGAQYQEYLRQEIVARLRGRVQVVDLAQVLKERLQREDLTLFFPNANHLNATGHRQVGEILRTALAF